MKNSNRLAVVGVLLLVPATILVSSGLLKIDVPRMLINPVTVLGGLLGALVVNLLAITRVQAERETGGGIEAVVVRIGVRAVNLAVLTICALLIAIVFGYAFVENFQAR